MKLPEPPRAISKPAPLPVPSSTPVTLSTSLKPPFKAHLAPLPRHEGGIRGSSDSAQGDRLGETSDSAMPPQALPEARQGEREGLEPLHQGHH